MERVVQPWHGLPRAAVESSSLEVINTMCMWHLGTCFSGEHGSA